MLRAMRFAIAAVMLAVTAGQARAGTIIVDQVNGSLPPPGNRAYFSTVVDWQQEVIAGQTGQLVGLDAFVFSASTYTLTVNSGSPWQTDASDFVESIVKPTSSSEVLHFDLSSANITLSSGQAFVFSIAGNGFEIGTYLASIPGGSYRGSLYNRGILFGDGNWDLGFTTYVELPSQPSTVTPEPTSLALAGFAGLGMAVGAWRRSRKPA